MTIEIIDLSGRRPPRNVAIPPLSKTKTKAFASWYGEDHFHPEKWTLAARALICIPNDTPNAAGGVFELDDCNALLQRLGNTAERVFAARGDGLNRLVCAADRLHDGTWLLTVVLDRPAWVGDKEFGEIFKFPDMPDFIAMGVLLTPTVGHLEALYLFFRIDCVDNSTEVGR